MNRNRVSADISSTPLVDVLREVASHTRWQVFVEPGTTRKVSVKFANRTAGEALSSILGDVNFALIPVTNGASKLLVFRTSSQSATQAVQPERVQGRSKVIANELIVRVKPGVSIEELAKMLGAKVVGRIEKLNAYRLQFEDEAAASRAREQLASNPEIASVESNYEIDRPTTDAGNPGGPSPIQLQMKPPPDSGRIVVGLIDTAVQPLGNNLDQFLLNQLSVAGPSHLDPNSPSHGTAMAETILRALQEATGGSTSVQILPIDIYGGSEATSTFNVAQGIIAAVNGGAKVINLSLGSDGDSPILREVVRNASRANILLISAAGNIPVTTPFYPAAYPEVRAVTAIEQGQIAAYASRGNYATLGGPSMNWVSFRNQTFGVEGTSVSSAFVSGAAAGWMDANGGNTGQASSYLQNYFGLGGR